MTDSLEPVAGVHVVNISAKTGTSTQLDGNFKILAAVGDSLYFSSIQFQNSTMVVKEEHGLNGMYIKLLPALNELGEVQIDDIRLTGSLAQDIDKVPRSVYTKLGWNFPKAPQTSLEMAVQSSGKMGGDPVGLVLNSLNGKIKELEKASKNDQLKIMVNRSMAMLGLEYLKNTLQIPGNEIMNFLYFNARLPGFETLIAEKDLLGLREFLEANIQKFNELRELN